MKRYAIRVTDPDGEEAWLRYGAKVGEGAIVEFRTKKLAEINADFVRMGLDAGSVVTVVAKEKGAS